MFLKIVLFTVEENKHFEENTEIVLPKSDVNDMLEQTESLPVNDKTK